MQKLQWDILEFLLSNKMFSWSFFSSKMSHKSFGTITKMKNKKKLRVCWWFLVNYSFWGLLRTHKAQCKRKMQWQAMLCNFTTRHFVKCNGEVGNVYLALLHSAMQQWPQTCYVTILCTWNPLGIFISVTHYNTKAASTYETNDSSAWTWSN